MRKREAGDMDLTAWLMVLAITVSTAAAVPPGEGKGAALPATIKMEKACARAGGMCLPKKECPTGQLNPTRGLCPLQQEAGVECCHGLSILERRCSKRGGECTPKTRCGRELWDDHAEDCSQNEACCILVT